MHKCINILLHLPVSGVFPSTESAFQISVPFRYWFMSFLKWKIIFIFCLDFFFFDIIWIISSMSVTFPDLVNFFKLLNELYYIYSCTMIITIQFYRIFIPQPQCILPPPELSPLETVSLWVSICSAKKSIVFFLRFHM